MDRVRVLTSLVVKKRPVQVIHDERFIAMSAWCTHGLVILNDLAGRYFNFDDTTSEAVLAFQPSGTSQASLVKVPVAFRYPNGFQVSFSFTQTTLKAPFTTL